MHRAGMALAQYVLHRHGVSWPRLKRWEWTERGRPYVPGLGLDFNVSHSEHHVACAVARGRVGVDVERVRDLGPCFARRMLSAAEQAEFSRCGGLPCDLDVVRLWTLKEAYLKCLGTGISVSPRLTELSRRHGSWQVRHRHIRDPRVTLCVHRVGRNDVLAVCIPRGMTSILEQPDPATVLEELLAGAP